MKKLLTATLALMMVFGIFAGCQTTPAPAASTEASAAEATTAPAADTAAPVEKIKIGFSVQNMQSLFPLYTAAGAKAYMAKPEIAEKYELMLLDPDRKADVQLTQVESMIAAGCKAIVINPVDKAGSAPAIDACVAAGIPVITVNTKVDNQEKVLAHIGLDDVQAGITQMEYASKLIGYSGNVAILHGTLGHSAQVLRFEGYKSVIDKYSGMKIVAEQETKWKTDLAQTAVENWLQSGLDIKVIVCNNDNIAIGAANAIDAVQKTGQIYVIGIDALATCLELIKAGKIQATFDQDAPMQGELAVKYAIDAIEGRTVSNFEVPLVTIDSSNVDDYLAIAAQRDALNKEYNGK